MKESRRFRGYWNATSIGIGGMLGGGIFAVLGLAVQLARGGTPVAFGIAGLVAILTAHSYARLSAARPNRGGTAAFLDWAFGHGILTGSLNVLLWLCYVMMIALYAYAFGSYGASFLPGVLQPLWKHVLAGTVIIAVAGLNILSTGSIARAERWILGAELTVLILFVGFGLQGLSPSRIAPPAWSSPLQLVVAGLIIFLAYEGFEFIANVTWGSREPKTTLRWAFYSAVLFVILLYILVATVAVGSLSEEAIIASRDYALAEAATPFLGPAGFALIAIAALFSTSSAINSRLYGGARLSFAIAKDGELPRQLNGKVWNEPLDGLLITAGLALVLANSLDLYSICLMGSAGFLVIFAAVNLANLRLRKRTGSSIWLAAFGAGTCASAFAALIFYAVYYAPKELGLLGLMWVVSISIEIVYRSWGRRDIHLSADASSIRDSYTSGNEESGEACLKIVPHSH